MKIDCSKLSNKGDLLAMLAVCFLMLLMGFVFYLANNENTFAAGFVAASFTWNWKSWVFDPIDGFLEKHWPNKN